MRFEVGLRPRSGRSTSSRCGRCWARADDKVADILNRVKDEELRYEADPRHVEKMLNDVEL